MEESKKFYKEARKLVNKILKNLGRNDLDYTVQVSISSMDTARITYSCQIQSPNNVLQPITFIKYSAEELLESLRIASENLNQDEVAIAWHEAEKARSENFAKYHQEKIDELRKGLEK